MKLALPFALATLLLTHSPALAQAPRSIADCERVTGDDAYNRCLASFGTRRGERRVVVEEPREERVESRSTRRGVGRTRVRTTIARGRIARGEVVQSRRGRQSAAFDISERRSGRERPTRRRR